MIIIYFCSQKGRKRNRNWRTRNKKITKKSIKYIAYPFGDYDERVVEIVKEKKLVADELAKDQIITFFLLPERKPITYKTVEIKEAQESRVLSKKDYSYAKEVFLNIKE